MGNEHPGPNTDQWMDIGHVVMRIIHPNKLICDRNKQQLYCFETLSCFNRNEMLGLSRGKHHKMSDIVRIYNF